MNFIKQLVSWKTLLIGILLIAILGIGFSWRNISNQPSKTLISSSAQASPTACKPQATCPSATCPQPPRNIDPATLTDQQRQYYGYPPKAIAAGQQVHIGNKTMSLDEWIQKYGVNYCHDTDQVTNFRN